MTVAHVHQNTNNEDTFFEQDVVSLEYQVIESRTSLWQKRIKDVGKALENLFDEKANITISIEIDFAACPKNFQRPLFLFQSAMTNLHIDIIPANFSEFFDAFCSYWYVGIPRLEGQCNFSKLSLEVHCLDT